MFGSFISKTRKRPRLGAFWYGQTGFQDFLFQAGDVTVVDQLVVDS
jgi:hypothetical protein